ncbi:MAG TPA: type II CAAX endopeptidase family protein [Bacillota bacterium]|nr:type II CAAX endopeptidase family protein [Bacillota bacterium]
MNGKKRKLIPLGIFIFVVIISGWLGVWVDSFLPEQPKGNTLGMGIFLVLPLATAILIRLFTRDWHDFGVTFNFKTNVKWYVVAFAIYPIVTVITVAIAWMGGSVQLSGFDIGELVNLAVMAAIGGFIVNIFEEFSWRGYLAPKLIELKLNDWWIYIITGIVWALWHVAYYMVFLPDDVFHTLSREGYVLSSFIIMSAWSIMYVEIYRLTKSVWPCVILHVLEDAVPTVLITTSGMMTMTKGWDLFFNPTSGIITTILFIVVGLILRSVRIKKESISGQQAPRTFRLGHVNE